MTFSPYEPYELPDGLPPAELRTITLGGLDMDDPFEREVGREAFVAARAVITERFRARRDSLARDGQL